jgi:hypothetical protein
MTLYEKLQQARSEEDVKDAYIKALGLKGYSKNLIDIQTKEIWFEAKDNSKLSSYAMFTQLMHYVQDALNKGHYVPPFLAVIDTKKADLCSYNIAACNSIFYSAYKLLHVEKLGIGQEIIFNEIDELKEHFNLGKRNWFKLLKGKLMDLSLEKVIEITLINEIFKILSDGFKDVQKLIP